MNKQVKVRFKSLGQISTITVKKKHYEYIRKHSDDKIENGYLSLINAMMINGNGPKNYCKRFCTKYGINMEKCFKCIESEETMDASSISVFDIYLNEYDDTETFFYNQVAETYYNKIVPVLSLYPDFDVNDYVPYSFIERIKRVIKLDYKIYGSIDDAVKHHNLIYNRSSYSHLDNRCFSFPMIYWIDIDVNLLCNSISEVLGKSYSDIFEEVTV